MAVRGLVSHLDLNVVSLRDSIEFYDLLLPALGFERRASDEHRGHWAIRYLDGSEFGIEVRATIDPTADRHHRLAPGIDHLAFHAADRDDVDAVHRLLVAHGVAIAAPPREYDYTSDYYAVAFDDPSGIRLEVVHDSATNPVSR